MATSKLYLKSTAAAILALAGFAGSAWANQTINVNFGCPGDEVNGKTFIDNNYQQAPAPYTGTTWNDYIAADDGLGGGTPATRTVNNLLDSDGNATTVGWTTATVNATPMAGPGIWNDHPNVKMLDGGLYRVTASGSGNQMRARFTVTGLDPAKTYNIYLAGSAQLNLNNIWGIGTASGAPGTTQNILNTSATKTAQSWKPGDNWLVFYNVAPIDQGNGTGNIYVWGQNLTNAAGYSGITLNGFQVVDATGWQNSDKSIYDFTVPGFPYPGVVSNHGTGDTITVTTLSSTQPWNALVPTFTLADNATCSPASGVATDFSSGTADYTVTAQDGSTKVYHVSLVLSSANDMLTCTLPGAIGPASIASGTTHVTLYVPTGTDVTALTPTFTLSPGATITPTTPQDFSTTGSVAYTVHADDGTTKVYTIEVIIGAPHMIGVKYSRAYNFAATDVAGAPGYEQANWTMAPGQGQGPPNLVSTPLTSLKDANGVATSVNVTSWTLSNENSWSDPATTLDQKLLADYCANGCSISFAGLSTYASGYAVVVYYEYNGRPQRFILTAGSTTIIRNVFMNAPASGDPFWLEGTDSSPGTASNYTVLGSSAAPLTSDTFTIALDMTGGNGWVGGTAAVQIVQLTAPMTPYQAWASTHGLTGTAGSSTDPAPNADPDKDGLANAIEYILGTNPTLADSSAANGLTPSLDGGDVLFTFNRSVASETTDTTVGIQVGTDLSSWTNVYTVGVAPEITVGSESGGFRPVTLRLPRGTDPRIFARLRVEIAP